MTKENRANVDFSPLGGRRILLTGGGGFLGSHLLDDLAEIGCRQVAAPRSAECDLRRPEAIEHLFNAFRPELVIHAAAVVGGIGANRSNPGRFFYENAAMGIHLIDACRRFGVQKTVVLGSICAYPKFTPVPFRESDLWNGYPEETNAPYGLAKKMLLVQCQAYRQQYGLNAIYLLPVNLYGPRDNFDLSSSHVIPAMIRKCVEAVEKRSSEIRLWGDGTPTREFLYVKDAAHAILRATLLYDGSEPVNIGSGEEISMRDLAGRIVSLTGFTGRIIWDSSQPNGQPRRVLDVSGAAREFGFRARTSFDDGLVATIESYRASSRDSAETPFCYHFDPETDFLGTEGAC
ncbi:MAG: GDP-L-fucose synthase [Acidobacteriota bacterium]|nr:GDP-L-fucose synthase [Acidobacteriota bacterium]